MQQNIKGVAYRSTGRFCFIANHSAAGGVGELWVDLAKGLHANGHESSLAALWPLPGRSRATSEQMEWCHLVDQKPNSAFDFVILFYRLVAFLRKTRPDLVVTAMPASNVLAPLAASLASSRIRVVTTHHTPAGASAGILGWLDRYMGVMPNVRANVCVSKAVAASYATAGTWLSAKQLVISNALPPRIEDQLALLNVAKKGLARRSSRNHVVALGRLAPEKNHDVLIRAAKLIPHVKISIIGEGPEEGRLRELAAINRVEDRVEFKGFMAREDAMNFLASVDIFVQMSRFEGHSLALIEAAKLGLPLIVSNIPVQVEGVTDSLGNVCGIVIDPDDEKTLANWIERLARNSELYDEMSRQASELARLASFARTVAKYERLLL